MCPSTGTYSPLPKRVETWGESRRALSYGIVWGRTKLKTNARAPKRSHNLMRPHTRPRFPLFLKVDYSPDCLVHAVHTIRHNSTRVGNTEQS